MGGLALLAGAFESYNRHIRRAAKEARVPYAEVDVIGGNVTLAHSAVERALNLQLKFESDETDDEDSSRVRKKEKNEEEGKVKVDKEKAHKRHEAATSAPGNVNITSSNAHDSRSSEDSASAMSDSASSAKPENSTQSSDSENVALASATSQCVAVLGQRAADDKWCAQSCSNVPPNCPPALCTCPSGNPTAGFQHPHKVTEDLAYMDKLKDETEARFARRVGD